MEFLTVAPHADPTLMTPILCSSACTSMDYSFSAIISSLCFCKQTAPIGSVKVADDTCLSSGSCATDSKQFCGYDNYMLVYSKYTVCFFKFIFFIHK